VPSRPAVAEGGLDDGFCASEPAGDLGDREALLFAVVACERDRPMALLDAGQSHDARTIRQIADTNGRSGLEAVKAGTTIRSRTTCQP
jgi:hypothetical protein